MNTIDITKLQTVELEVLGFKYQNQLQIVKQSLSNIYKELENRSKKETPKVALKVTDVPPVTPSEEVKENETPNK